MDPYQTIHVLFLKTIVIAVVVYWAILARCRVLLKKWAKRHEYQILSARYCWLWAGPFASSGQNRPTVYRLEIRDKSGKTRAGYANVGAFFFGLFNDDVAVVWDDER